MLCMKATFLIEDETAISDTDCQDKIVFLEIVARLNTGKLYQDKKLSNKHKRICVTRVCSYKPGRKTNRKAFAVCSYVYKQQ